MQGRIVQIFCFAGNEYGDVYSERRRNFRIPQISPRQDVVFLQEIFLVLFFYSLSHVFTKVNPEVVDTLLHQLEEIQQNVRTAVSNRETESGETLSRAYPSLIFLESFDFPQLLVFFTFCLHILDSTLSKTTQRDADLIN